MKTFLQWIKEEFGEGLVGVYPPGYDSIGNYPPNYFNPSNVYIAFSRIEHKPKKGKKKKKKK